MSASDLLSVISIILGILAIVLSIYFYVKASKLSDTTKLTLEKIDDSTKRLETLSEKYIDVVFKMFQNTHDKMTHKMFEGEITTGGSTDPNEEKKVEEKK